MERRGFFATINITRVICWDSGFALHRLRSAPFEGAAIGIPPALPQDCYSSGWFHCPLLGGPLCALPHIRRLTFNVVLHALGFYPGGPTATCAAPIKNEEM